MKNHYPIHLKGFRSLPSSFPRLALSLAFSMQSTLARSAVRPCSVIAAAPRRVCRSRNGVAAPRASGLDTNIFVNVIESAVAIAIPVAVSIVTAEKSDDEFMRTKSAEGLIPIGAAVAADAVAHSIPGELALFFFSFGFEMGVLVLSFDEASLASHLPLNRLYLYPWIR